MLKTIEVLHQNEKMNTHTQEKQPKIPRFSAIEQTNIILFKYFTDWKIHVNTTLQKHSNATYSPDYKTVSILTDIKKY